MRIKIFLIGDSASASSYYRGYELGRSLSKKNIAVEVFPSYFPTYPLKKNGLKKIIFHTYNLLRKVLEVLTTKKDEIIFVRKAITPYGSPWLELIAKKILGRTIVFDVDDAYFIPSQLKGFQRLLEPMRTHSLLSLSDCVITGSHHLEQYARKYNRRVYLVPTSVDTTPQQIHKTKNPIPVIGWTGSHSTLKYLKILVRPLGRLAQKYTFEFRIMGANEFEDRIPQFNQVRLKIIPWSREREWNEIAQFDIGVMPLFNTSWEKSKCSFKAIQYMNLGIPAVCSPVGENQYLIQDGINGFLATTEEEWVTKLEQLIINQGLREKMGRAGRKTIEQNYSLETNTQKIIQILQGFT